MAYAAILCRKKTTWVIELFFITLHISSKYFVSFILKIIILSDEDRFSKNYIIFANIKWQIFILELGLWENSYVPRATTYCQIGGNGLESERIELNDDSMEVQKRPDH